MDCGRGSEQLQLRELGACRHTHTHTHIRTYTRSSFFLLSPPISFFLPPPCLSLFFPLFILWTVKKRSVEWESGKGGDSNTADLFFFFFLSLSPSQPSPGRLVRCVAKPVNKREFDAEGDTLHSITAVSVCDGSQCCLLFSYFSFLSVFLPTCVVPLACFA